MRIVLALLLATATALAAPWSEETLDLFARLPVQEGGRLKPFSTVASFALLRINHQRSFRAPDGTRRSPVEWALEALFRPDDAHREHVFLIENDEVLDALDLEHAGKKRRDRYSYEELVPARDKLISLGHRYSEIDAKKRNPVQGQVVVLAQNFLEFEGLLHFLDFARAGAPSALRRWKDEGGQGDPPAIVQTFGAAFALALLPPLGDNDAWMTPKDAAASVLGGEELPDLHWETLFLLEDLCAQRDEPAAFDRSAAALFARGRATAQARGDYGKVNLEVAFYRLDPFTRSLALYVLAFLVVAVTWLRPHRWLSRAALALTGCALGLHATGIVVRCLLRGRPPVSTLYETVLFIGAVIVLSALAMEVINRRRVGLLAGPLLGAVALFLAARFEEINREDTMPQLVAVLDTNFWLATHVTCISIGYAAGLLAGAIAHLHVLGRAFGLKRGDDAFYRGIARMVYGVTCFALIFSVVGTILGGVWANESWGRFWGWDPKENGALLIVLGQLALLHGRMGGFLRDQGVCMAAIFGGCVVAFSWWGVNLLGVGLHSYGFTEGVWTGLLLFYGLEALVLLAGVATWLRSRGAAAVPAGA
jgi:ABC-type transport system involved in cytochrome c biogenesis permease subunit